MRVLELGHDPNVSSMKYGNLMPLLTHRDTQVVELLCSAIRCIHNFCPASDLTREDSEV